MSAKKHILLVEDEENFGSLLQNYLRLSGYEVNWQKDGALGYSTFKTGAFDLCILDVMMPNMDGYTLAEKIREQTSEVPLIFLTARNMKEDVLKGYRLGADDYLSKPFDIDILLHKLDVVLSRSRRNTTQKQQFEIGAYAYDASTRQLEHPEDNRKLSPKEGALLSLLCEHMNDVLPRETALKEIWKEDSYFTTRSMDVYITKLRKYLKEDSSVRIENVHSRGYGLFVD